MRDVTAMVETALWKDALAMPETISMTLDAADGHAELAELLKHSRTKRVIVTGNGASWYVATAFWLATFTVRTPCEVVAVPAGVLAADGFEWREGDTLLAFSSSGELRDLVEVVGDRIGPRRPLGLITAVPDSTLGAAAEARAMVAVRSQHAVTHTQAYVGAAAVAFDVLGRWAGDTEVREVARKAPELMHERLMDAPDWAHDTEMTASATRALLVVGTNHAWVAALEAALLFKEVAGLPAEGMEVREGTTTGMYPLGDSDVVLALAVGPDPLVQEAARICAGTGASVRRVPTVPLEDARSALFAHFAHPLALSIRCAVSLQRDPDHPSWVAAYQATARTSPASAGTLTRGGEKHDVTI